MSRWVVAEKPGLRAAESGQEKTDDAIGRITKYIPAEILSAYTMVFTLLVSTDIVDKQQPYVAAGIIGLFLIATLVYISMKAGVGAVRKAHLIVSPVAFIAWSYPISSAVLGHLFLEGIALFLQVSVILLSIFIKPVES